MTPPTEILELVERFGRNLELYKRTDYKETRARVEFIDPFFEALGWDVRNVRGYAEQYKDVVHEAALKIGGTTQAPDYSFRIGGARKFFLEAKKPSVWIKGEIGPAYQLRRYAWSSKLPLSILTDFEEFAVYDCRQRPKPNDKASVGRVMYFTFDQYPDRFDEIHDVFAREAVLKGSFDRYVRETKGKRGTGEVDAEFLKEIEGWRDALARNIALRNPGITVHELNFGVQRTIDRIIFLRICEDRAAEEYGRLLALTNGSDVYARLHDLYRQADEKYNSGLFDFRADRLTKSLKIDDKTLKPILAGLYYPQSPYEFSVLPADILGQVYEQFLGKVIRLTPAGRARVEEKPEVKKAGGVYYTPTYVVDYIVRQTVGKLVDGKTPRQIAGARGRAPLRILDPACGSGSFLLGAYQYLLDYHRRWYEEHDPEKHARGKQPALYQAGEGNWRLTTAEKKRILLNHIYGVDIDRQAVEVTKLSLLLKVLEGETGETLGQQLSLWRERALPDLGENVKCGNSLIGPDYFAAQLMPDEEEMRRVNPFDWEAEFPHVFRLRPPRSQKTSEVSGGFDCVIGNPPYIRIQTMKEWAPTEVEFYKQRYAAASKGNYDIYIVFVERALQLLNEQGRMGYILPHKFFNAKYGEPLRELIAGGNHLAEIVHFGDQQVFAGASTYTCLLFLDKQGNKRFHYIKAHDLDVWRAAQTSEVSEDLGGLAGQVRADKVTGKEWNFVVGPGAGLFERLSEMPVRLGDVAARMYQGSITSADTVYLFKEYQSEAEDVVDVRSKELDTWVKIEQDILEPVIRSGNISRYTATPTAFVLFPYEVKECTARLYTPAEMREQYPLAWAYLKQNKRLLENREGGKFKDQQWYRFGRSQNLGMWEQTKLMVPYMITDLATYYDQSDNFYFINVTTGGYGITVDEAVVTYLYLCGLLNSRLLDFYLKRVSTSFRGGYLAANKQFIERLPIRTINFSDPADAARHERMVALVERMLALHQKLAAATVPADKQLYQRQIEVTDRQIDALVYELYGLSEEEIGIVEDV